MAKAQKKIKAQTVKSGTKMTKAKAAVKPAKLAAKPPEKTLKSVAKVAKSGDKAPKSAPKAEVVKPVKAAKSTPVAEPAQPAKTESQTVKVSLKGVAPKAPKAKRMSKAKELMLAEKAGAMSQKWLSLFKKSSEQEAKPYNLKQTFEAKTAIMHKVLGWGYILTNKNDRLEVLFKDGIRFLISNYKA